MQMWAGQNFRWIVTIIGGATILRVEYKIMLRAELAEFFLLVTSHLWHSGGTLVANDAKHIEFRFKCLAQSICVAHFAFYIYYRGHLGNHDDFTGRGHPWPQSRHVTAFGVLHGAEKERDGVGRSDRSVLELNLCDRTKTHARRDWIVANETSDWGWLWRNDVDITWFNWPYNEWPDCLTAWPDVTQITSQKLDLSTFAKSSLICGPLTTDSISHCMSSVPTVRPSVCLSVCLVRACG